MSTALKDLDSFVGEITEEDRQKAGYFCDNGGCLVATMLKRMGGKKVSEEVYGSRVDGVRFEHEPINQDKLFSDQNAEDDGEKPFYRPEVVGLKITFTRGEQ